MGVLTTVSLGRRVALCSVLAWGCAGDVASTVTPSADAGATVGTRPGFNGQGVYVGGEGAGEVALCGRCGRPCVGRGVCDSGVCLPPYDGVPRLLWPVSLGRLTSRRPTFRWLNPVGVDGGRVEVCRDRPCAEVLYSAEVTGAQHRPDAPLSAGLYFWRVLPRRDGVISPKGSHTWEFVVRPVGSEVDTAFGRVNDLNGDGYADVVLRSTDDLRAGVYRGGPAGLSSAPAQTMDLRRGDVTLRLSEVDDVDGDGYADLLVTERTATDAAPRRALLRRGGDDGVALMDVPLTVEGAWPRRLSAAGDIDGDGFGDLLGIDPPDDGKPGRAVVYFGNAEGLHPVPSALSLGEADLAAVSLSTRGDLDGDGLPDLLVGEPTRGGGAGAASAWINGGACGEGALRPLAATTSTGASLGASVASTGDFDADGYVDPVVGAPFSVLSNDQSLLWLYRGAVSASTSPTPLAFPSAQREGFTLGAGGDVDGDGYGDLVVWMHNLQRGPMMFVFRGGAEGLARTSTTILPQQYGSTETAISFRAAGDTDRDGRDDLIVLLSPGHVVLARGTPEGVTVGPLPAMTLP